MSIVMIPMLIVLSVLLNGTIDVSYCIDHPIKYSQYTITINVYDNNTVVYTNSTQFEIIKNKTKVCDMIRFHHNLLDGRYNVSVELKNNNQTIATYNDTIVVKTFDKVDVFYVQNNQTMKLYYIFRSQKDVSALIKITYYCRNTTFREKVFNLETNDGVGVIKDSFDEPISCTLIPYKISILYKNQTYPIKMGIAEYFQPTPTVSTPNYIFILIITILFLSILSFIRIVRR